MGLIQLSLAPFQGDLWETLPPGLKPRAESSCPFLLRHPDYGGQVGVENPLRNLKLMLMGRLPDARMLSWTYQGIELKDRGHYELSPDINRKPRFTLSPRCQYQSRPFVANDGWLEPCSPEQGSLPPTDESLSRSQG